MTKRQREQLKESLRLSKINEDSSYFHENGVLKRIVGTKKNINGSWSHNIKTVNKKGFDAFEMRGAIEIDKILLNQ